MAYLLFIYPLMGLTHIIASLLRFCFGKDRYPLYKNKLAKYLLIVGIYFLIMILFINVPLLNSIVTNDLGTVYIGIVPWFIAAYYWTIIYGGPAASTHTETHS